MNNKSEYEHKLDEYLIPLILNKNKVKILEFGVQNGISTKKFLEVCEKNDGKLYSADIIDCSKLSDLSSLIIIGSIEILSIFIGLD